MLRKTLLAIGMLWLASAGLSATLAAGIPTSASKVDATARYVQTSHDDTRQLRVHLAIADGWHVNAHPASLDFLVPTSIRAFAGQQALPLAIDWPQGHDSGIQLGGTAIEVYSDDTVIPVTLEPAAVDTLQTAPALTLRVRVQACSDKGICLPPSDIDIQPPQP